MTGSQPDLPLSLPTDERDYDLDFAELHNLDLTNQIFNFGHADYRGCRVPRTADLVTGTGR